MPGSVMIRKGTGSFSDVMIINYLNIKLKEVDPAYLLGKEAEKFFRENIKK
jgi:hypothetical protein